MRQVSVADMLKARDQRVVRQQEFLDRHAAPLISLTMNIAGPVKVDAAIRRAFQEGVRRVNAVLNARGWPAPACGEHIAFTGCEALWAVQADAAQLKADMCRIEESDALGRLMDIDVIGADGAHLSRGAERACLICGGPVRACARNRAHPAEELFAKAQTIIREHFQEQWARRVGETAQKALLYEAITTPKPGLVDCENSGAHTDMDLFSFVSSACALRPYFEECARMGQRSADFDALQSAGMQAEDAMLTAAGANTHKGAVFSMGILCCAAGCCGEGAPVDEVLDKAAELGTYYLQKQPNGAAGARGEAASGFRTVRDAALPAFEQHAHRGVNAAGLETLLRLMGCVEDTNLIRRAGREGWQWAAEQAREALRDGYTADDLRAMNRRFVERNLSPGGSADLLAVTYFLHFLKGGAPDGGTQALQIHAEP